MQQAVRWRRKRLTTSRAVLVRWVLALAVIVVLCPSGIAPTIIVRAHDHAGDDERIAQAVGEASQQTPTAPAVDTPAETPGSSRAAIEPPPGIVAAAQPQGIPPEHGEPTAQQAGVSESAAEQPMDEPAPPGAEAEPVADEAGTEDKPAATEAGTEAEPVATEVGVDDESAANEVGAATPLAPNDRLARRTEASEACPAELSAAKAASFKRDDRLVMTYYYYWYDQESLDDPAMAQHPPNDPPLDWRSVAWHERQFLDMATAGIDVALAVYWGDTSEWSVEALPPMVEARENLLAAGYRPPAIGLFFDTNLYATILTERPELADLTTDDGQAMLAHQVGVFFDQIPPCHRARVDGRPLAFFWRADTEDGDRFIFDSRTFAGLNDLIAEDHEERLHLVLERTWQTNAQTAGVELGAADIYRWGAALNGPRFQGRTVAVGPGYDDRQIAGRPGYSRERVDGETYSRDLRLAVMSGTPWLLLETWNEVWEGTAIAETEETGRTYLGITARYTALFHQLSGEKALDGWVDLGSGRNAYLRRLADFAIEQGMPADEAGRSGARPLLEDDGTGYFHFAIDHRLHLTEAQPLIVQVEYFDEGEGSFTLEYDSLDGEAFGDGAYKSADTVHFENSRTWRVHRFDLPDASLRSRQYDGGGDFRIHDRPGPDDRLHLFGRVMVTAAPASRPVPFEPEGLTFIDPSPHQTVSLRWSEAEPAPGYLVLIQPLSAPDVPEAHGFTSDDRRRCDGEANVGSGRETWGLARRTVCELRLGPDLEDGMYRWRVQAVDANGSPLGDVSDWGFFVVVRQ